MNYWSNYPLLDLHLIWQNFEVGTSELILQSGLYTVHATTDHFKLVLSLQLRWVRSLRL